jgi:type IV pilus assembly protein PilA
LFRNAHLNPQNLRSAKLTILVPPGQKISAHDAVTTMTKKVWLKLLTIGVMAVCVWVAFLIASKGTCACSAAAYEAAAIGSLRSLHSANLTYAKGHPAEGYSQHLNDLSPQLERKLSAEVFEKSGYKFAYTVRSPKGGGKNDTYEISADPKVPGKTGNRRFFMDETGIIRVSATGPANASDPALN